MQSSNYPFRRFERQPIHLVYPYRSHFIPDKYPSLCLWAQTVASLALDQLILPPRRRIILQSLFSYEDSSKGGDLVWERRQDRMNFLAIGGMERDIQKSMGREG